MEALIFIVVIVAAIAYFNKRKSDRDQKPITPPSIGVFKSNENKTQNDVDLKQSSELTATNNNLAPVEDLFSEYSNQDIEQGLKRSDGSALKNFISRLSPSENGLYPHEILLLHYAKSFTYGQKKYQNFWYYRYFIPNVQSVLHSLMDRDFLALESLQDRLNAHTLKELKPLLEKKGLKSCKRKADAISLIIDNYEYYELPQKLVGDNNAHYVLTNKGLLELNNNQYVLFAHKDSSISLEKLNHVVIDQRRDYIQAFRESLKKKAEQCINNKWKSYRYFVKRYAEVCASDGNFTEGIRYLSASIAFDLNASNSYQDHYAQRAYDLMSAIRNYFPYEQNSLGAMSNSLVSLTQSYLTGSGLEESQFKKAILSHFIELKDDGDIFSPEQLSDIVMLELHEDVDSLEKLYLKIKGDLQKELDTMPQEQAFIRSTFQDKYKD